MSEIKLCKDCKWFKPDEATWETPRLQRKYAKCGLTARVTGFDGAECEQRRNSFFDACGKHGKQWEAA